MLESPRRLWRPTVNKVILRPQALEAGTGVLTCSGCRKTPGGGPCFSVPVTPTKVASSSTAQPLSRLQGVRRRSHRFVTSEWGGQRDGSYPASRSWLDHTGPLVRLLLSMDESRSQQPPGNGVGPGSDRSHTHSKILLFGFAA